MKTRVVLMLLGFAAAFAGDWFLAIRGCGVRTPEFLCGVAAFSCAHLLWCAANWRESKVEWKALPVVIVPVLGFFLTRVRGNIPDGVLLAVSAYAVVSAVSLAVAVGTRRWFYSLGIACLVLSDVFIATRWAHAPHWGSLVGPVYILSLVLVAVSLACGEREPRFTCGKGNPLPVTLIVGVLSAGFFVWAAAVCPGGHYNPLFKMLSYLGRTSIGDVAYPLSHYLFCLGLACGAAASLYLAPYLRASAEGRIRKEIVGWGMAVCVSGLLLILMVPENVNGIGHNGGCHLAMVGGIPMASALATDRFGKGFLVWMGFVATVFAVFLALHVVQILPFAPYVPTTQKVIIVSFVLWQLVSAVRIRHG